MAVTADTEIRMARTLVAQAPWMMKMSGLALSGAMARDQLAMQMAGVSDLGIVLVI